MKSKKVACVLLFVLGSLLQWAGNAVADSIVNTYIEKALLAEDWKTVVEKIKSSSSPVLRAIRGHACLALNRSNESLNLFASVGKESDLQQWKNWTNEFEKNHADKAVAYYFVGDALARSGNWQAAQEAFTRALELHANWYLALNARGVVHHALGNTSAARVDFRQAIEAKADFADGYASRGTLDIYVPTFRGKTSKGPGEWFEKSKGLSPGSIVALNGLGCAAYMEELYDEASTYFRVIPQSSPLFLIAQQNALAAELYRLLRLSWQASDAGMHVNRVEVPGSPGHYANAGFPWEPRVPKIDWVRIPPEDRPEIDEVWGEPDGTIIAHLRDCTIKSYPPPKPEGGEGEGGEGEGEKDKGKKDAFAASSIAIIPPSPSPQIMYPLPLASIPTLTEGVAELNKKMQQHLSSLTVTPIPVSQTKEVGGVDGNVKMMRTTKKEGRWNVYSLYGLLYKVQFEPARPPAAKELKQKGK